MRSAFTITWLALCASATCAAADAKYPELTQIRLIYLAPMGNALDQYLANRLTQGGRFQVVTDPQIADAILTDRIGETFEAYLANLYPPPAKTADSDTENDRAVRDEDGRPRTSSIGRARGNIYLIDRASRKVIWSDYRRPRNTQPDQLDELADYFAVRLRKQAGKAVAPPPPPPPPPAASPASPEPKPDTVAPAPK